MKLFGFIIQSKSATHPLSFLPLRKSLAAAFLTASAKAGFPCSRILAIVLDLRWPSMLRMVGMMLPFLLSSSLKKSASFLKSGVSDFSSFPAAVGSASADFLSELCKEFFSLLLRDISSDISSLRLFWLFSLALVVLVVISTAWLFWLFFLAFWLPFGAPPSLPIFLLISHNLS